MKCRSLVVLVVLFLLSACAGTPSNKFVHVNSDSESKIGQMARVAIIADVCLMRDVLGDGDYWTVQESRSAEEHMLDAAKTYLAGKGYEVTYAQAPFVGGFKDRERPFRVCDTTGGEVLERNPPLFESEGLGESPAFREALLKIIPNIPGLRGGTASSATTCCSNPEMKNHLNAIAKTTGGDATLFLIGHGVIVSAGKQLTQGITTGLLTAALTLGTVSVSRYNVSYFDSFAVLVDNITGEILWSNSMRLKGDGFTDKAYYDAERWPKRILYHMPLKTEAKRKDEAEPKINEGPSQAENKPAVKPEDGDVALATDEDGEEMISEPDVAEDAD